MKDSVEIVMKGMEKEVEALEMVVVDDQEGVVKASVTETADTVNVVGTSGVVVTGLVGSEVETIEKAVVLAVFEIVMIVMENAAAVEVVMTGLVASEAEMIEKVAVLLVSEIVRIDKEDAVVVLEVVMTGLVASGAEMNDKEGAVDASETEMKILEIVVANIGHKDSEMEVEVLEMM